MTRQRQVVFVSHPDWPSSGSSYLRAQQMMEILAAEDDGRVFACRSTTPYPFTDALLIFDKNATQRLDPETLADARRRGNRVLSDPVDGAFPPEVLNLFDGVIAASRCQTDAYRESLAVPTAYVRHHVDLRLPQVVAREDRFAAYYFGEFIHARHREELDRVVTFVLVNTKDALDTGWMGQLGKASAHYALRPPQEPECYKPFTKGFIAAHCDVPVLLDTSDKEARAFLPEDYPYWTNGADLADVRSVLAEMAQDHGTARWAEARAMMRSVRAHCSASAVAADFRIALRDLA